MVAHLLAIYLMAIYLTAIYLTVIQLTIIRSAGRVPWISRRLRATIADVATGMAGGRAKFVPAAVVVAGMILRRVIACRTSGGAPVRRMRVVQPATFIARRLDAPLFVKRVLPSGCILCAICRAARVPVGSARSFWSDDALHTLHLVME
jgi:hypothetical protein